MLVAYATKKGSTREVGEEIAHTLAKQPDVEGSRKQLARALAATPELEPVSVAIFGSVVDPAKLRFPFSRMPASDTRDWDAIDGWPNRVLEALDARLLAGV